MVQTTGLQKMPNFRHEKKKKNSMSTIICKEGTKKLHDPRESIVCPELV
jgi:hypothetical protein